MIARPLLLATLVSLATACGAQPTPDPNAAKAAMPGMPDKAKVAAHLGSKVKFPATKEQVVESFEDTPDFTTEEITFIRTTLSPGTYAGSDTVTKALGLQ